jgi:hypothetical protein
MRLAACGVEILAGLFAVFVGELVLAALLMPLSVQGAAILGGSYTVSGRVRLPQGSGIPFGVVVSHRHRISICLDIPTVLPGGVVTVPNRGGILSGSGAAQEAEGDDERAEARRLNWPMHG